MVENVNLHDKTSSMIPKQLLVLLREKMRNVNRRLLAAMACYFVLILVALYTLLPVRSSQEGFLLGTVLFIFAILIVKTLVHSEDDRP
jgi:hypothetical protein